MRRQPEVLWPGFWLVTLYSAVVVALSSSIFTVPESILLPELVLVAVKAAKVPNTATPMRAATETVRRSFIRVLMPVSLRLGKGPAGSASSG